MKEIADVTSLLGAPIEKIVEQLELALPEGRLEYLQKLGLLLFERTLFLVPQAPRDQIRRENMSLQRFLCSSSAQSFRDREPELFGMWAGLGILLSECARRSDRASIPSVLASYDGKNRILFDIIVREIKKTDNGLISLEQVKSISGFDKFPLTLMTMLGELEDVDLLEREIIEGVVCFRLGDSAFTS